MLQHKIKTQLEKVERNKEIDSSHIIPIHKPLTPPMMINSMKTDKEKFKRLFAEDKKVISIMLFKKV